jgi:hypothetical protein
MLCTCGFYQWRFFYLPTSAWHGIFILEGISKSVLKSMILTSKCRDLVKEQSLPILTSKVSLDWSEWFQTHNILIRRQLYHRSNATSMCSLTLDLWLFDLKINRGHLLFSVYKYTNFYISVKQGVLKILSRQYFPTPSVNWPLTFWF